MSCKNKCHLKISEADQIRTFDVYRQAVTIIERYNFLKKMTRLVPKKERDLLDSGSLITAEYYLNTKQGRTSVCKSCFRQTINEADYLIEASLNKKWREVGPPKQSNDSGAPLQDLIRKPIREIEKHINKFLLCENQDFSAQGTEKYLPMGLSLDTMYDLHVKEVCNPVSLAYYNQILNLMNLKFEPAVLEKCANCEVDNHLIASELSQRSKAQDEIRARSSNNSILLCSFGFKKTLPTPWLNDPTAYYKRRLWTYNLTVQQNSVNNQVNPKFYMWHEGHGKKTANEIASCLYQYLLNLPPTIKCVIFYSNSCCQESRSKTIANMFSQLMANHKTLEYIEHKFLGYSQTDDVVNRLTENIVKKHQGSIHHPKDWYNAFSKPFEGNNKPEVVVMTPENFYNFKSLWKDPLEEEDESFIDKEVKWLRYTKEGDVFYKKNWLEAFKIADLELKSQCEGDWKRTLRNLGKVPISTKKKQDLLDLLPLMNPDVKSFYEELLVQKNILPDFALIQQSESLKKSSSELKGNLKEIVNLENIYLHKQARVGFESDDQEFVEEKEDKENIEEARSKQIFVVEIEGIKIKSSTGFSISNEFIDVSKSVESSEKIVIEDNSLLLSETLLSQKPIEPKELSPNSRNCKIQTTLKWKPLPPCDEKCHLKISKTDQIRIFNCYSQIKSLESKLDFVSNMIEMHSITPEIINARYFFKTDEGCQTVCRNCFICGLGEVDTFITTVLEEKFQKMNGMYLLNRLLLHLIKTFYKFQVTEICLNI